MRDEAVAELAVIGGGGHVGLPLAMAFADSGLRTLVFDVDPAKIELIRRGQMPFREHGGEETLTRVLASGMLTAEATPEKIRHCDFLILVVGTPVDEHLNPSFRFIRQALDDCLPHLRDGQTLIFRSTVYPGFSAYARRFLQDRGLNLGVAVCPERVSQGYSLKEFRELPQIVAAFDPRTLEAVQRLFSRLNGELIVMEPMEAELCKLMTNAWRYIQFATVNQFYMIATQHGLDFDRILHGCRHNYPRMAGVPGPGLAAGPCLVKDTMQLAAFSQNSFVLGHSAMLINEGLPAHLVELARRQINLAEATCGILGMAFKGDSDDPRDSLSYKLRKLLAVESRRVLCCDPYVPDTSLVPLKVVLDEADIVFVAAPHQQYHGLNIDPSKKVIDVWGWVHAGVESPSDFDGPPVTTTGKDVP